MIAKPPTLLLPVVLTALMVTLGVAILHDPHLTILDLQILNQIHTHATPTLTVLAKTFSVLGSPRTIWPATLAIAAILWLRNRRHAAVTLLATMATSGLLESLLKLAIRRPRPNVPWAYVHENTYSFPSGHATLALALYGLLAAYALRSPPLQRVALITLSLAMTASIGLSRLYLGAHHPTDVLAGYLTGATCLLAVITFNTAQKRPPG